MKTNFFTFLLSLFSILIFFSSLLISTNSQFQTKYQEETLETLISKYENEVLPKFKEIESIKNDPKLISRFNFLFKIKFHFYKFNIKALGKKMELLNKIEKGGLIRTDYSQIESLVKEIKNSIKYYEDMKKTMQTTNKFHKKVKEFFSYVLKIILIVIVIGLIVAISVIFYIVKCMKYQPLLQDEDNRKKMEKIVRIANTITLGKLSEDLEKNDKSE